jgi:hypothetical protein
MKQNCHCGRFREAAMSRRQMLWQCANGVGGLALMALMGEKSFAGTVAEKVTAASNPMSPRPPHFPARAKNVIFLHMDGGPSQVDTFDPKPRLQKESGQPFKMKMEPTQFNSNGMTLGSPWAFKQYGQSGIPVSDLFPHLGRCADHLCVVRSMTSEFSEHTGANYLLHTGLGLSGRPSIGAWVCYGLGSINQNLPGFVVLNGGLVPRGGLENFGSGFLPASFQGSVFRAGTDPLANIEPQEATPQLQRNKLDLMRQLDRNALETIGHNDQMEAAIANYELAFRMQSAVPDLVSIQDESAATRQLYGLNSTHEPTRVYGLQCLIARRLVERGVRFIEVTCPNMGGDRWDQHGNLKAGHEQNALAVDQPMAALLQDLHARGLLEQTLIVWGGEFGRTPFAQGTDGRDHNPFGYSMWLAGGGVKAGSIYGATDEYGYKAVENKIDIHDLHATLLYLLGVDHKKLTVRFSGRDMRLTDVHGDVIHDIVG